MTPVIPDVNAPIRFEPPFDSIKDFEVRMVYTEHYKSAFWVLVMIFLMSSLLLLLPHAAIGGALCMALFGFLIVLVRRTHRRAAAEPVVLEAYDDGIWFNWLRIFVPYERLANSGTRRVYMNGYLTKRLCRFSFLVSPEEGKRIRKRHPLLVIDHLFSGRNVITVSLPGQDGVMSPGLDEIEQRIKLLSSQHVHMRR